MQQAEEILLTQLQDISFQMESSLDAWKESQRSGPYPVYNNWASILHHPCKKMLTHARLHWKERRPMSIQGLYRVEEGHFQEKQVKEMFSKAGFEVDMSQTHFTWDKYQISGRIDGVIRATYDFSSRFPEVSLEDLPEGWQKYLTIPIEIKSVGPQYWRSTTTIEDIKRHPKFWIRRMVSQLNLYLLMMELEGGLLVLKTFGQRPRILPMTIDYGLGEHDVRIAEEINACVLENKLPERIPYDPGICDLCDWEHICEPVKTTNIEEMGVTPETVMEMHRFCDLQESLEDIKPEFNRLRKHLIGDKQKPGLFRGKNASLEGFEISTKLGKRKTYKVPQDIKEQFMEEEETISTSIERTGENGSGQELPF